MIITTARKPSPRTRTFCRHLSRFTGWGYIPRGKTSLAMFADEPFLLVGERHGNPWSFNFFLNGRSILSIQANVSMDKETDPGEKPVIEGVSPLAHALSKATGHKIEDISDRVIRVNDHIEFVERGIPFIILKVLGKRGEGIV